jgi:hypothetical protein
MLMPLHCPQTAAEVPLSADGDQRLLWGLSCKMKQAKAAMMGHQCSFGFGLAIELTNEIISKGSDSLASQL